MNSITTEPRLRRQAHIRTRRNNRVSCVGSLSVIAEEDDMSGSRSSSPSSSTSRHDSKTNLLKSARRRANIISDPFQVTLTQVTYPFPHPPVPTPSSCPSSPSSSSSGSSSAQSSPSTYTSSLPTTPEPGPCFCDEDDIPFLHCTKPLVIHKKGPCEEDDNDSIESDLEEEYHYYTQEFQKILSLASLYEGSTSASARPESVCMPSASAPTPPVTTPPSPRRNRPRSLSIIRPPPRMSLPVAADMDDDESSNVLMYYIDSSSSDVSSGSVYSDKDPTEEEEQDDCASNVSLVDFEFEMDDNVRLRLPLSLPCSPIDLEADIHEGLQELRAQRQRQRAVVEVERLTPGGSSNGCTPSSSSWSFDDELACESDREIAGGRALRSKWSTSTLGSVKQEKSTMRSRMLPTMFSPKKKRAFSFRGSPSRRTPPETPSSMLFSPASPRFPGRKEPGLQRRSSTSTDGSCESGCSCATSSEGSSGLRRKPIPVDLFMKI